MKKLFIALLLGATTLTAFAQANWNANTVEELKIPEEFTKTISGKIKTECAKALIGKNATNISYPEYKEIIKKTTLNVVNTFPNLKPNEKEYWTKRWYFIVPIFPVWMKKFQPFQRLVVRDPEVNNDRYVVTYYYQIPFDLGLTTVERRNGLVRGMKKFKDNLREVKLFWDAYKKIMDELDPKVVYTDLKELKRALYINIQKSDDWKTILVEIELATKALE